jgi:hypothetical protein
MAKRGIETQSVAKKEFSLNSFKEKLGLDDNSPEKELKWIPLSPAFVEATGLKGIPMGKTTLSRGFSNVGKSTILFEAAVSCQQNGILPIIIDTENNVSKTHLEMMGFDWGGEFMLIDNDYLYENYGKKDKDPDLKDASIEDVAKFIHDMLDMQDAGQLPYDICFLWDSIGSIDCKKSNKAKEKDTESNNMWNAGALEKAFKGILNHRIPASGKISKQYTNTFVGVQKIWIDNMNGGGVKHKGGEAFFYGARLIIHFGGIAGHATQKLKATKDKRDIAFGIETKINVVKNQVNGISLEGKIASVPHGFIGVDKASIDAYKKANLKYFKDTLGFEGDDFDIISVEDDTLED